MNASYGDIVCWTVRDLLVPRSELLAALQVAGFSTAPRESEKRTHLRRALDAATQQSGGDYLIRLIGEDATRVSYAVVTESKDLDTAEWYGRMHESVVLRKDTNELEFRINDPVMVRAINSMIVKLEGMLNATEVAACIKQIVTNELKGTSLRDTGGVYFVPASNTERLTLLEQVLAELCPPKATLRVHRLRVMAGVREASDIAAIFCESVMFDADKLKGEAVAALQVDTTRKGTFQTRAKKIGELIDLTKQYEAVLYTSLQQTIDKLAATRKVVVRCLTTALKNKPTNGKAIKKSSAGVVDDIEEE